jgi:ribosome-associated translation inhibitor RaiA
VRTIVKGKNLGVPDSVRQQAGRKVRRLRRFLDDRAHAAIGFPVGRNRSAGNSRIAEGSLKIDGQPSRGRAHALTCEAAVAEVMDRTGRRAVDFREKPRVRARGWEEKGVVARIARGIAEALTTTIFGLAIAVPCVIAHSYFVRRIEMLTARLEGLLGDLVHVCQTPADRHF